MNGKNNTAILLVLFIVDFKNTVDYIIDFIIKKILFLCLKHCQYIVNVIVIVYSLYLALISSSKFDLDGIVSTTHSLFLNMTYFLIYNLHIIIVNLHNTFQTTSTGTMNVSIRYFSYILIIILSSLSTSCSVQKELKKQPHIVLIIADDLVSNHFFFIIYKRILSFFGEGSYN
jgi:hypothetical protein